MTQEAKAFKCHHRLSLRTLRSYDPYNEMHLLCHVCGACIKK